MVFDGPIKTWRKYNFVGLEATDKSPVKPEFNFDVYHISSRHGPRHWGGVCMLGEWDAGDAAAAVRNGLVSRRFSFSIKIE